MSDFPTGIDYLSFATLDSTNEQARRLVANGHDAHATPVWIRADCQTAGRGRKGRHWTSPIGNLMATYLCAPSCEKHQIAELSFVAGLALYDTLKSLAPDEDITLKWPNDVLLNGAKISGILLETMDQEMRNIAVGIGVNLETAPTDTPYRAIALRAAIGQALSPELVLIKLAHHFLAWQKKWEADGFAALKPYWLERVQGLGEKITIRAPHQSFEGVFSDITDDGRLILTKADGEAMMITAGDVYFEPLGNA